jgi:HK97 family phage prohead protease
MARKTKTSAKPIREVRMHRAEVRAEQIDGQPHVSGYASTFNELYPVGGFYEKIHPKAFDKSLRTNADVRCLYNHDVNFILGRTKAGTLKLSVDEKGLAYDCLASDGPLSQQALISIERGDVDSASFSFSVPPKGDVWTEERTDSGVRVIRTIMEADLYDVGPNVYPANPGATASLRTMFPEGMPTEMRSRLVERRNSLCECHCPECLAGDCETCSNPDCDDPNCDANEEVDNSNRDRLGLVVAAARGMAPVGEFRASVNGEGTLELLVYEQIGWDWWSGMGVTASVIKSQIDNAGDVKSIKVRINSPGGDVFEGIAIYNMLRAQKKPVAVYIDGLAASAASIIAMAGDTITMGVNTMMMVHNVWSQCVGYASDMRKMADMLDKTSAAVAQTFIARGLTAEKVAELMNAETWLTAPEALALGLCTGVGEEVEARSLNMARSFPALKFYRNVPKAWTEEPASPAEDEGITDMRMRLELAAAE